MELNGKVALVTGGAKRIGRALALALAEQGCSVIIHYGHSAEAAQATVANIEARGVKAWSIPADLNDEAAVKTIIPSAWEAAGRLDILINNAAIFPQERFLAAESAIWDQNMMINLKAPFLLSQAFAQALPDGQPGKIINMLDSIALRPKNHHFSYTISKYGLAGLTQAMAHALAPRNIQVNGLALGTILPASGDEALFEKMAANIPARQTGSVAEVIRALLYLLEADYVVGEIIRIDGGKHLG